MIVRLWIEMPPHIVHVNSHSLPLRPNLLRSLEDIEPCARAQINHGLAFTQVRYRERVATAQSQIRICRGRC